jgi:hypothetical protein
MFGLFILEIDENIMYNSRILKGYTVSLYPLYWGYFMVSEKKNGSCSCPFAGCKRYGDCEACLKHHKGKGFCKRLGYVVTDEKLDHVGHEDFIMMKKL